MTVKVSVVIPAYKAASTIRRAVESCLEDDAVAEVIVVVDGPDQALIEAIPAAAKVQTIVSATSIGAPAARNIGLRRAQGEFTLFLDADDYVEGGLIGSLARAGTAQSADLILGSYVFEFPSGRRIPVNIESTVKRPDVLSVLKAWFSGLYVPCCSVLWRSSFVRDIGGWDESLNKNQDGEMVWRACGKNPTIAFAAEGFGIYFQGTPNQRVSGNFSDKIFRQQIEVLANLENDLPRDQFRLLGPEIGSIYYRIARIAYYNNYIGLGEFAEKSARRLGFSGHEGQLSHRFLAQVLGLKRKERFSAALHRAKHALGVLHPKT